MGIIPSLIACLFLTVPSFAAEAPSDPRLVAVSSAAAAVEAGLLNDLRGGGDPAPRLKALAEAEEALSLVPASERPSAHEGLKARLEALARSGDGIRALSAALKSPDELRRAVPNPDDTTPRGAALTEAFVVRVAELAAPLGVKERAEAEDIALFYLRKRSPQRGGRAGGSAPGEDTSGEKERPARTVSLPADLGRGAGVSVDFGRAADGSREREDTSGVAAGAYGRPADAPAAAPLRADIAPVRGPDAPPPPGKRPTGPPDPPLKGTSHQAMADTIVGEFGIVSINGKPDAMQVVITARGGGENGTAHIKGEGGPEWARARLSAMFPGEAPFTDPTDMRLARIDHIINVQGAVNSVAPIKESDPWYVKSGKSLKRMPTAAGAVVVTILYDTSKLVDQTFGTSTGSLGGQDFSQASPADLKNTLGAIWMAVKSPFLVEE